MARDLLSQALQLAAPQDYYRAFLDEDELILTLLRDVRHVAPAFVDQLRDYASLTGPGTGFRASSLVMGTGIQYPLVEPLSQREMEVLDLIAAGFSNREIAERLYIAHGTVKRHISNIYGKLGVRSRTQALARARELGML
jgi:LuxR family maltose regulon positive regulatory protein